MNKVKNVSNNKKRFKTKYIVSLFFIAIIFVCVFSFFLTGVLYKAYKNDDFEERKNVSTLALIDTDYDFDNQMHRQRLNENSSIVNNNTNVEKKSGNNKPAVWEQPSKELESHDIKPTENKLNNKEFIAKITTKKSNINNNDQFLVILKDEKVTEVVDLANSYSIENLDSKYFIVNKNSTLECTSFVDNDTSKVYTIQFDISFNNIHKFFNNKYHDLDVIKNSATIKDFYAKFMSEKINNMIPYYIDTYIDENNLTIDKIDKKLFDSLNEYMKVLFQDGLNVQVIEIKSN